MSAHHAYGGDCPGMLGRHHWGGGGLGMLGSAIPAESYLYPSLSLPADADKEYYAVLGAIPAGLAFDDSELGDYEASANDGQYVIPFDLYEYGVKLAPQVSLTLKFGNVATINLAIANLASVSSLSTGAASVTPAAPGVVNLAIANLASASTLSTVAATVTPYVEPPVVTHLDPLPVNRILRIAAQNRIARF